MLCVRKAQAQCVRASARGGLDTSTSSVQVRASRTRTPLLLRVAQQSQRLFFWRVASHSGKAFAGWSSARSAYRDLLHWPSWNHTLHLRSVTRSSGIQCMIPVGANLSLRIGKPQAGMTDARRQGYSATIATHPPVFNTF